MIDRIAERDLKNADYFVQIFIEPKGKNIKEEQLKEDLFIYINEHEADIIFEDETEVVRIKGVKFYTMKEMQLNKLVKLH